MSLAPREQHLLARIEHSLRSTDPRLARMLATFTLPAFRGGLAHLYRSRGREFVPPALALVVIGLIICCGLLLGHPGSVPCAYRGMMGGSVNTCRATGSTAGQPGHLASHPVTGNR
jgi:peptidoglycan/LPS O-acetylase OafA/YrhL